jgi:8-oxo-(d)GTP phosphatase
MTIRAAGGVVWRATDAQPEVAVIHRPHRRDWGFPKGKLDDGEDERTAAIREVGEEIGAEVELGDDLGMIDYVIVRNGEPEPKTVRYWAMRYRGGDFTVNDEVDELRWLPVDEAAQRLTYDRDREVLRRFVAAHGG